MNIADRIAKKMTEVATREIAAPVATSGPRVRVDVQEMGGKNGGVPAIVITLITKGLSKEERTSISGRLTSGIKSIAKAKGLTLMINGPSIVLYDDNLAKAFYKGTSSITAIENKMYAKLKGIQAQVDKLLASVASAKGKEPKSKEEAAAVRKAGDADLLVGSLKAAIKHANNAKKSDTQKEFLKCARTYLKECC